MESLHWEVMPMNITRAQSLIQKHRSRWNSSASDASIARKGAALYSVFGFVFMAQSIWMVSYNLERRNTFMLIVSLGSVAFSAFLLAQAWRFWRIHQRLAVARAERLEDLRETSH